MNISPFRYPGAKSKFLPKIFVHLEPILETSTSFIDVFTGGGSVLLSVASKYPKISLFSNDKDYWIYCFWKIVSDTDTSKLNNLISLLETKPTLDLFYKLRNESTTDEIQCAYKAIFFNRTAFSGILSSGPIGGKEQKSKYTIDCRFNFIKLKAIILNCNKLLAGRTIVTNCDFSNLDVFTKTNNAAYCDPPYYLAGKSLYVEYMNSLQHQQLRDLLSNRQNWVLSYDDCSEIRELYSQHKIIDLSTRYSIDGKKENWKNKNELIILP